MLTILFTLLFISQTNAAMNWCYDPEEWNTNKTMVLKYFDCDYNQITNWQGWEYLSRSDNWEKFRFDHDCCFAGGTEYREQMQYNYMKILNDQPTNKEFLFNLKENHIYQRKQLSFDVVTSNKDSIYFIHFENPPDNTEVYFRNDVVRSASSYTGLKVYKKSVHVSVNETSQSSERVRMYFESDIAPFVVLSGKMDLSFVVIDSTNLKANTCSYPFVAELTKDSTIKVEKEDSTSNNYKIISLCDIDNYQRVLACGSAVENYHDCTCTYINNEYTNHYTDCYNLSSHRTFNILPNQLGLPYEYKWFNYTISEETSLTIPKTSNITFLGEVHSQKYPMKFNGKVYVNGTLYIDDPSVNFELGTFYINKIQYNESNKNVVLFKGKRLIETQEEKDRLENSLKISEQNCGYFIKRYIPSGSDLGCSCTQKASTEDKFEQFDCESASLAKYEKLILKLSHHYNGGNVARYWGGITATRQEETIIKGIQITVEGDCDFRNANVRIQSNLKCGNLILSSTSKIIVDKEFTFTFDKLTMDAKTASSLNLNKEPLITNEGIIDLITSMELDIQLPENENCFELASSVNMFDDDYNLIQSKDYKFISINNLLRVCNINKIDKVVLCKVDASLKTETIAQCPCDSDECTYLPNDGINTITFPKNYKFGKGILKFTRNTKIVNIRTFDQLFIEGDDITIEIESEYEIQINKIFAKSTSGHEPTIIMKKKSIIGSIGKGIKLELDESMTILGGEVNLALLNIKDKQDVQITLGADVTSLNVAKISTTIETQKDIFKMLEGTNPLSISSIPVIEEKLNNQPIQRLMIRRINRDITLSSEFKFQCDSQSLIINLNDKTEKENCEKMNIYKKYCYRQVSGNYLNENGEIDYSCPCNKENSICSIGLSEYDSGAYDISGVNEVVLKSEMTVIGSKQSFNLDTSNAKPESTFHVKGKDNFVHLKGRIGESFEFDNQNNIISLEQFSTVDKVHVGLEYIQSKLRSTTPTGYKFTISKTSLCTQYLVTENSIRCLRCGEGIIDSNGNCKEKIEVADCQEYDGTGYCVECIDGYYLTYNTQTKVQTCTKCQFDNCLRCTAEKCLLCESGKTLTSDGKCQSISQEDKCEGFVFGVCRKCSSGSYLNSDNKCSLECKNSQQYEGWGDCTNYGEIHHCDVDNLYIEESATCEKQNSESVAAVSSNSIVACQNGYYKKSTGECEKCSVAFDHCELCTPSKCIVCQEGYIATDMGNCIDKQQSSCENIVDSICYKCPHNKYFDESTSECIQCPFDCYDCYTSGECASLSPNDELYFTYNENNEKEIVSIKPDENCEQYYKGNCIKCKDHKYMETNNTCMECSQDCKRCYGKSDYCIECNSGFTLHTNEKEGTSICKSNDDLLKVCDQMMMSGSGCAICKQGYYRSNLECKKCGEHCKQCYSGDSCNECEDKHFLWKGTECRSYDELIGCISKSHDGCEECEPGYFISEPYCKLCKEKFENCDRCLQSGCSKCSQDFILIDGKCVHYKGISKCIASKDNKCSECSFWYAPTANGTYCEKAPVVWLIVLIAIIAFVIVVAFFALFFFVVWKIIRKATANKNDENINYYKIDTSDIPFVQFSGDPLIVVDKEEINFDQGDNPLIPVEQDTYDSINIGNVGKSKIKIQFTVRRERGMNYYLATEPEMAILSPGEGCEFKVVIYPKCSCKINDTIELVTLNIRKGEINSYPLKIVTETQITTKLDYNELKMDQKLGEGGFGIVYKGDFRGNTVAIKLMKMMDDEDAMEEFRKEVSMLDKFRSEYIVHFFGAVFVSGKICMVTEFAKFGSLMDVIKKKKRFEEYFRFKFMWDAAKGIKYLHDNGIIHRDIKCDNILVFTLEKGIKVNAKLTDFGASRNVNQMKANMTFTRGIGTPAYMAPEILDLKRYTEKADIFSFAITMYECYIWGPPYPQEEFKFPWLIAEYITKGNRRPKTEKMPQWYFDLVEKCWDHEPDNRPSVGEIIETIENNFTIKVD